MKMLSTVHIEFVLVCSIRTAIMIKSPFNIPESIMGSKPWTQVPQSINGFKIVKDLGIADNGVRYGAVICKACKKEFKTSLYHLKIIKGCGCNRPSKIKNLPKVINGFKIIKDLKIIDGKRMVIAECKICDRHYKIMPTYLKYRKHCGCMKNGGRVCSYSKSHPRLNGCYKRMKKRCYNKKDQDYYNYGARGIEICKEWLSHPDSFCKWALDNGYENHLSIDRIDGNKGYSPENCRWSTPTEQARNTRRNVLTMDLAREMRDLRGIKQGDIAKMYNVSKATVWLVLNNKSWVE